MLNKKKAKQILNLLKEIYTSTDTELIYSNPYQLTVSTILSAQCTDERVNRVSIELFKTYPLITDLSNSVLLDLEKIIFSTGYYKSKSRRLKLMAQYVIKYHDGIIPNTMSELVKVPGIGRKTANVILNHAFNISEGVVVDTHVKRLSNRLGLSKSQGPRKIEQDLMKLYDYVDWNEVPLRLIFHGRKVCKSRKPMCDNCEISAYCQSFGKF